MKTSNVSVVFHSMGRYYAVPANERQVDAFEKARTSGLSSFRYDDQRGSHLMKKWEIHGVYFFELHQFGYFSRQTKLRFLVLSEEKEKVLRMLTCTIHECTRSTNYDPRYPHVICAFHGRFPKITEDGKKIEFYNLDWSGGFKSIVEGVEGIVSECYIKGVKCRAEECKSNGIIIQRVY